jgi:hypothetical protein
MKNPFKLRITYLSLMLLAVLAQSTTSSKAWTWWVDELGDCSASYISIGHSINGEYAAGQITQQQWRNLQDQNMQQMQNCVTQINVPRQEPDFCAEARSARDQCIAQFYGLGMDFTGARMECIAASGIDQCE